MNMSKQSLQSEYSDILNYLTPRGSRSDSYIDDDTIIVKNVEVP